MPRKSARKTSRTATTKRKKPAAGTATKKTQTGPDNGLYLNIPGHERIAITPLLDPAQIYQLVNRWSHSLRNRERWAGRSKFMAQHRQEIKLVASQFGLTDATLAAIAEAGLVEVEIPYIAEQTGWELRIMPWEYLLASSTRELRGNRKLTVVRYLRRSKLPGKPGQPRQWHYLESAAGDLRTRFDFTIERQLIETNAKAHDAELHIIRDPDAATLENYLKKVGSGDVLHIAGFDSHQGLRLLDMPGSNEVPDGILLRKPSTGTSATTDAAAETYQVLDAHSFAKQLAAGGHAPAVVTINLYNSAARTAALCVAEGADAAIGFQDAFDDSLAEVFFSTFYNAWRLADWNTAAAFRYAWYQVTSLDLPLHGSGLVLWSAHSIRDTLPGYWGRGSKLEIEEIDARWNKTLKKWSGLQADTVNDQLEIDIEPVVALNYSILHNNGPLFERFTIRKCANTIGRVTDLHVMVELHVGTDSYPFRLTLQLGAQQTQTDLSQSIHISLASALSRALRESVRTSLFVEVLWKETVLYRETHTITLLPIDEWKDTDECRIWLPSFVLPRDPAVLHIIDRAQRYLMAIADDPSMGFSGYQGIDNEVSLDGPPEDRCYDVDAQVRAIWSSLMYELPLSYINPPPVFSDYSQRLRTPSDVIEGKRGTCIDLALLLASCLEYVEIYPVIFLLNDHAFPGYWRDEAYYEQFVSALVETDHTPMASEGQTGQRYSWYLERGNFREILAEIHAGRLVPLESVYLTEHQGFSAAMDAGMANLTSRRQFQAMLDIISARWDEKNRVTPLPIIRA